MKALVDTGAACSILASRVFKKIRNGQVRILDEKRHEAFYAADSTPLPVIADVEVSIKIGGISAPTTVSVVDKLNFDLILGMDFFRATNAVVNLQTHTLSLFEGLTTVAMTTTGEHPIVATAIAVVVPPMSEAVVPVTTTARLAKGDYVIEGGLQAPCRALLIGRTLVNGSQNAMPCKVMNPTDKPISLRRNTPIGTIAPAIVAAVGKGKQPPQQATAEPTLEAMQSALTAKGISLADTALKGNELDELIKLLYGNIDIMAATLAELPGTDIMRHRIDTGDSPPVRKRAYRHSPADKEEINRQVNEMLDAGIIEESDTPWSSPVLLVSKKDGTKRFVVDFRGLNAVTSLTSWPLPTMEEVLDSIAEQKPVYWTSLDLRSGYWQAELDPITADRTGFQVTDLGNFAFKRLPFGLCGAVQFFQMLMQKVLRGLSPTKCLIYLDDILVMGKDAADMNDKLQEIFQRFREARLRIHPAKCHWAVERVKFLGHVFDKRGISVDDAKFAIIRNFPVPTTAKGVRSFLGLANYYRRFVNKFSQVSAPLRALLKADAAFKWTEECQQAFDELKQRLINAPILVLPDFKRPFVLTTDASTTGIAYILGQRDDEGREHVVAYGGRGLKPNETRWSVSELECLALIEGTKQYHTYLAGGEFEIVTDHISLTYLHKMKLSNNNRLARWALFLQGYRFKITYKKGETLTAADAISRMNLPAPADQSRMATDRSGEAMAASTTSVRDKRELPAAYEEWSGAERTYIEFSDKNEPSVPIATVTGTELFVIDTDDPKYTEELRRCPDLGPLWTYLAIGVLPEDKVASRKIVAEAPDYLVSGNRMYHLYSPRTRGLHRATAVIRQLCVPTALRPLVATELHDNNAHLGFDRLYATARIRYFWPGMYVFLRDHVLTCLQCQQAKRPINQGSAPIISLPVPLPTTRWHLDHHGPFPMSQGKRYILVLIDSTSMWPELIAVEDTSAETVVRALFDHVIARHGVPSGLSVLTDNGSAFISKLAKLTCQTFGIKQYFTAPYNPRTNARAEELAATIHDSLKIMCNKQADWALHLQAVAMAYRASATTNTGISPYEVIFGRPMRLAIDWSLAAMDDSTPSAVQYAREIGPKLEVLHNIAMTNAEDSAARHRQARNETAKLPPYATGDKVLLKDTRVRKGESMKLKKPYTGPFVITECRPGFNYRLQELSTGRDLKRAVHADRLRLLKELPNDYRTNSKTVPGTIASDEISETSVKWAIVVGKPTEVKDGIIVRFEQTESTEDGVWNVAPPSEEDGWRKLYLNCLTKAELENRSTVKFVQPMSEHAEAWSIAQSAAEALGEFAFKRKTIAARGGVLLRFATSSRRPDYGV